MTPAAYRAARLALGLTQEALADILDVSKATVERREKGTASINNEASAALLWIAWRLARNAPEAPYSPASAPDSPR